MRCRRRLAVVVRSLVAVAGYKISIRAVLRLVAAGGFIATVAVGTRCSLAIHKRRRCGSRFVALAPVHDLRGSGGCGRCARCGRCDVRQKRGPLAPLVVAALVVAVRQVVFGLAACAVRAFTLVVFFALVNAAAAECLDRKSVV